MNKKPLFFTLTLILLASTLITNPANAYTIKTTTYQLDALAPTDYVGGSPTAGGENLTIPEVNSVTFDINYANVVDEAAENAENYPKVLLVIAVGNETTNNHIHIMLSFNETFVMTHLMDGAVLNEQAYSETNSTRITFAWDSENSNQAIINSEVIGVPAQEFISCKLYAYYDEISDNMSSNSSVTIVISIPQNEAIEYTINQFIPIIVVFALLGAVLASVKKFGK